MQWNSELFQRKSTARGGYEFGSAINKDAGAFILIGEVLMRIELRVIKKEV